MTTHRNASCGIARWICGAAAAAALFTGGQAHAQSLGPTGYWQYHGTGTVTGIVSSGTNTAGVMTVGGTAAPAYTTAGMVGSGVAFTTGSVAAQSSVQYLNMNVSFGTSAAPTGGYALGNTFSLSTWYFVSNISSGLRTNIWDGLTDFDIAAGNTTSGSTTMLAYGGNQNVSVAGALATGTWHNLVQVFSSASGTTTMTAYLDGVSFGSPTPVLSTSVADSGIRLATGRSNLNRPLTGTLDETAVWAGQALSATQVLDVYNRGLAGVYLTNTNAVRGYVTGTSGNAWLTGANWTSGTAPGVTANAASTNGNVAVVGNYAFTGGLGIDMGAASGNLALGAISFNSLAGSGALSIGNSSATSGTLTLNGAQIDGNSNVILSNEGLSNLTIANVQGSDSGQRMTLQLGGTASSIRAAAGRTLTVATDIGERTAGSALSIDGGGTVVFSGSNAFSGSTTVTAGTLSLGNVSALRGSTLVAPTGGAAVSFAVPGTNTYTLGGLSGSGALNAGGNTLEVGGNGGSSSYSGNLTAAALVKQGGGTLTMTGSNAIGATTISGGAIFAGSNGALGSGTVTLAGGLLQVARDVTITNQIVLTGGAGDVTFGGGLKLDYLLVGGGGGGAARDSSGGGGGGGVETGFTSVVAGGTYSVTVGAGGAGAVGEDLSGTAVGGSGGSSSFGQFSVLGGGGGGGYSVAGRSGASGGGGGRTSVGGSGIPGEGFDGGIGTGGSDSAVDAGGGGGGAGGVGGNAVASTRAGSGGIGVASDITGTSTYYGGGGGGTGHRNTAGIASGTGGLGGGGNGSEPFGFAGNGVNGLGGGGGAARSNTTTGTSSNSGGSGGSGVVVVRYLGGQAATGGTVTSGSGSAAGYTLHTFSGTGASSFTVTDPVNVAISGAISGTGGFTWNSAATLELSGNNTYTGQTVVSAGKLLVNGNQAAANGSFTVAAGAALGGDGTIGGATVINGLHTPGNSPGLQTFSNGLQYTGTGTLQWELFGNTVAGRGTAYDGINLTGGALVIDPGATLALNFGTTPGSTVDWDDPFWNANRQWTVIDVSGSATWNNTPFANLTVGQDTQGRSLTSVRPDASFSVGQSGGDLVVTYAVPEPATLALAAIGVACGAGWATRRWRRRREAKA